MPDDALIHLRVPAATKAAWVRASRAAGLRLTDWIVERVSAQPDPEVYLAQYASRAPGAVAVLSEAQLREVMRRAYLAGAGRRA